MSILTKLKNYKSMLRPVKVVKRFKDDEEGVAAVEFAFVAFPFFLLIFAIIETSLLFFANQYLETVVDDITRLYRTGNLANIDTRAGLKQEMCNRVRALFDCNNIILQLDTADRFSQLPPPPTVDANGVFNPEERFPPRICESQNIQLTASYLWPIYANYSAPLVSDGFDNQALISVTAVAKTEGFPPPPGCPGA